MCESLLDDVVTNNNNNNNKVEKQTPILTSSAKRRASSRLTQIPEAKRPYYGPNPNKRPSFRLSNDIPEPYYAPNPQSSPPPTTNNKQEEDHIVTHPQFTTSQLSKTRPTLASPEANCAPNPQSSPPTTMINSNNNESNKQEQKEEEDIVTPPQLGMLNNSQLAKTRSSLRLTHIPTPYYGPKRNITKSKDTIFTPQQLRLLNNSYLAKTRPTLPSTQPQSSPPPPPPTNNIKDEEKDVVTPPPFIDSQNAKKRASLRLSQIPRPYYGPKHQSPSPSITTNTTKLPKDEDEEEDVISTRFSYVPHSADDIAKVKSTLRTYTKHYLHFVQDENARANVCLKRYQNVFFFTNKTDFEKKQELKRPDLIATIHMRNCNEILYPRKIFGHLPGIDVGCHFYSQAEMVAVGIHSHWLYGIDGVDYMGKGWGRMEEFKGYRFPLAVAIVCSGQYEDDEGNREEIEYTGDFHDNKRQIKNQEMSPQNLALKNCMEQSIPVRFIRGLTGDKRFHGDTRSKLYTYDGLYKIDSYQLDAGKSGFAVYKFRLKRLGGQPKLTSNKVQYNKYNRRRISSVPELVSLDITGGQEDLPIPVINTIDDTTITGFTYTKSIQVPSGMKLPPNAAGCKCKGSCTNSKTCACAKLNGGDFPYVKDSGGRLIEAKDVVFECGPNCGCGPGCINRVSQRDIKYQLEIFRTSNRGWAVKTKDFIPSGAPICEYIGQLRRQCEMDKVDNNEYIFEIDCEQTIKEIGGRERRLGAGSAKSENVAADEKENIPSEPEFCIEAGSVGNVARFINHSCDPNLFVQCVVSSHHDLRLARIILFASDNIPQNQELTYDYGYALDSVVDENGNVQKLTCHCGTSLCRGRLY